MIGVVGIYKYPLGACTGEYYKCKSLEQAQKVEKQLKKDARFADVYIDETEDY